MARINPNNLPTELSYADLWTLLINDVITDECIPKEDKREIVDRLYDLFDLLWKYSA